MSKSSATASTSFGWMGLLGVIFVCLKLFGLTAVADWSWWLVLLPFWIGIAIVLGICAVLGILAVIVALMDR